MTRYSVEQRTRKMSKDIEFCHSQDIYPTNMGKNYWILLQNWD